MTEHIVQTNVGIYHFSYLPQSGLCIDEEWSRESLVSMENKVKDTKCALLDNAEPDFDVISDKDGTIHLVCQDSEASILHLYHDGEWHKQVLLQSKTPIPYPKYFRIVIANDWVNLFYIIEHQGRRMLTHHILQNDDVTPNVVDVIDKSECETESSETGVNPFFVTKDSLDNPILFYVKDGRYGYRQFCWSEKEWNAFTPLDNMDNLVEIYPFVDSRDGMHIIGVDEGQIIHVRSGEVKVLGQGKHPILMERMGQLKAMWTESYYVRSTLSDNYGENWRPERRFMVESEVEPILYAISSKALAGVRHCYGYYADGKRHLYELKLPEKGEVETNTTEKYTKALKSVASPPPTDNEKEKYSLEVAYFKSIKTVMEDMDGKLMTLTENMKKLAIQTKKLAEKTASLNDSVQEMDELNAIESEKANEETEVSIEEQESDKHNSGK